MIPRIITCDVESALNRQAAVALIGPRQVGKTTLALEIGRSREALYLDLEDRDDRNRLAEPTLFLDNVEDRLVILDEIHRMPSSSGRCAASSTGAGARGRARAASSSWLGVDRPVAPIGRNAGGAHRVHRVWRPFPCSKWKTPRAPRERLWLRGGFPDSYLAQSDRDSLALPPGLHRTYLERDLSRPSGRASRPRPWNGCGRCSRNRQGTTLNASVLARAPGSERAVGDPATSTSCRICCCCAGCRPCTPTSESVS